MYPSNIKSAFLWNQQYPIDVEILDVVGGPFCVYSVEISRDNDMGFAGGLRGTALGRIYQLDSGETLVSLPQGNLEYAPYYVNRPYVGFEVGDDLYAQITDPTNTGLDGGHDTGVYQFEVLYTEQSCASSTNEMTEVTDTMTLIGGAFIFLAALAICIFYFKRIK